MVVINEGLADVKVGFRPTTLAWAKARLRLVGMTLVKRDGEYIVKVKGTGIDAPTSYFTNDIDDAVATGLDMARRIISSSMSDAEEAEAEAATGIIATPVLTFDEYGHAVIDGERATDPYGHLNYTLGVAETRTTSCSDIICFDAAALPDGRVEVVSVLDCGSGSFVQDFQHDIVPAAEAEAVAERMIDAALDWFAENWPGKRVTGKRSIQTFRRDLKRLIERNASK